MDYTNFNVFWTIFWLLPISLPVLWDLWRKKFHWDTIYILSMKTVKLLWKTAKRIYKLLTKAAKEVYELSTEAAKKVKTHVTDVAEHVYEIFQTFKEAVKITLPAVRGSVVDIFALFSFPSFWTNMRRRAGLASQPAH